jgi:hypothetical protein
MWFDGDYIEVQEGLEKGLDRWGKKRREGGENCKSRNKESARGRARGFPGFFGGHGLSSILIAC